MFGSAQAKDKKKYISLQEAAKYSEIYSQGYLSLRARQGKLKAVKLGRNWVTTKEWVSEYVNNENNVKLNGLNGLKEEAAILDSRPQKLPFDEFVKSLLYSLSGFLVIASFVLGFSDYKVGTEKIIAKISAIENPNLNPKEFYNELSSMAYSGERIVGEASRIASGFKNFTFEKLEQNFEKTKPIANGLSFQYQSILGNIFGDVGQVFASKTKQIFDVSKKGALNLLSRSEKIKNINSQDFWQTGLALKSGASDYALGLPIFLKEYVLTGLGKGFQTIAYSLKNYKNTFITLAGAIAGEVESQGKSFLGEKSSFFTASLLDIISQSKKGIATGKNNFFENLKSAESFVVAKVKKGARFVTGPWLEKDNNFMGSNNSEASPAQEFTRSDSVTSTQTVVKEIVKETVIQKTEIRRDDSAELAELKAKIIALQSQAQTSPQTIINNINNYSSQQTAPVYVGSSGLEISGAATLASLGVSGFAGIRDLGVGNSFSVGSSFSVDKDGHLVATNITSGSITADSLSSTGTLTVSGTSTLATTTVTMLGVGTTTPYTTLDVLGNIRGTAFYGDGSFLTGIATGATTTFNSITVSGTSTLATTTVTLLAISQDGTVAGELGIGTASPITQLHVPGKAPALVGSTTTLNYLNGVYVQGSYAYVLNNGTDGSGTYLEIIDISNPSSFVTKSTISAQSPTGIHVLGKYAYVVNQLQNAGSLQIYDVSNPSLPVCMSTTTAGNQPLSIYVQGKYAYIVNLGTHTLDIYDISNPSAPIKISTLDVVRGNPISVSVQGKYVYVVFDGGNYGFEVVDVSNPAVPVTVALVDYIGNTNQVYVQGSYAYVANASKDSLNIIDISNPSNPINVGTTTTFVDPYSVVVQGRYAYTVSSDWDTKNYFQVFDISTPSSPFSVATTTLDMIPNYLFIKGRHAYVVGQSSMGDNYFEIFDLGGAYVQQFEAGGIETGTLQTRSNLTVNKDADIKGGLVIGRGLNVADASSFYTTSSATALTINQSGTGYGAVINGGNVGIGTTTPYVTLDINGDLRLSRKLYDGAGSSGTVGQVLWSTGTSTTWVATSSLGIVGSTATTTFASSTITGSGTTTVNYVIGGNLNVGGTIYGSASGLVNIPATTTFNSATISGTLGVTGTSTLATTSVSYLTASVGGSVMGKFGVGTTTPIAMFSIKGDNSAATPLLRVTTSTLEVMYISADGKIGMGTTSPSSRFAISGTAGSKLLDIGFSTGTSTFSIDGSGLLTFNLADHASSSMVIQEGNNTYLTFDTSNDAEKIVVGKNLEIGPLKVDADSGVVMLATMDITATAATSTVESLSIGLDGTAILTVYGENAGYGTLQNNRVGIGTTTPVYALDVRTGAVAGAGAYVDTSSHSSLKEQFQDIFVLDKIKDLRVDQWQYKAAIASSTGDFSRHLYPTTDEFYAAFALGRSEFTISPEDIAGVALKGVKDISQILTIKLNASSSLVTIATTTLRLSLANLGIVIDEQGEVSVAKLKAGQLEVGSQNEQAGITIYDRITGDPYCLQMVSGAMVSSAGKCGDVVISSQEQIINNQTGGGSSSAPAEPEPESEVVPEQETPPAEEALAQEPEAVPEEAPTIEAEPEQPAPAAEEPAPVVEVPAPAEAPALEPAPAPAPAPEAPASAE